MIRQRVERDEEYTAIVIPTRYGKSDIARVASLLLKDEGLVSCTLALSPNTALMEQLADAGKWNETLHRYGIELPARPGILTLRKVGIRPNSNGETFLSTTMQLAEERDDDFAEWIEAEKRRTGLRVLIFVDECHTGSEDNQWGKAVQKFVAAGSHAVLATATAERSDGKRIPGFEFEEVETEDIKVWKTSESDRGPEWIKVSLYEGQRTKLRLKPDLEISFREAWTENALCKVSRTPFDVAMNDEDGNRAAWLSELPVSRVRVELGRVVRRSETIAEGCKRFVDDILRRRLIQPDAAGIIYCGNDNDREDPGTNKHARQIQREIKRLAPELDIPIVTISADKDAADTIKAFRNGRYDGIIVKQMAGVGLDVPRVKTGLDLSPTRTFASLVQRMMRPATPYNGHLLATWIQPDDVISRAIFQRLVKDEGGEATITDLEKIDEWNKPKEDGPGGTQRPLFGGETGDSDFDDTDGNEAPADLFQTVGAMLAVFPELAERYSHAEIATRLRGSGVVLDPQRPTTVVDIAAECDSRRANINEVMHEYMTERMRVERFPYARWGEIQQDEWVRAKRLAGWPNVGLKLDQCTDLGMLDGLLEAIERIATEFHRNNGRLW